MEYLKYNQEVFTIYNTYFKEKQYIKNPKKCKKGHMYINNKCINCDRTL